MEVGIISDTHGLMRPEALDVLRGVDLLVHAGDVGSPRVLDALRALAPVTAVRGNTDVEPWAEGLAETAVVEASGILLYVLHDLHALDIDPVAADIRVVVAGHSHRPLIEERGRVLYVNPGSAGPRRFRLPVSVARLHIAAGQVSGRIHLLRPAEG